MQMRTILGFWLLSASLLSGAQAASFDCDKAASGVEKMICADNTLSNLDIALSSVYGKALFRSTEPSKLKAAQRSWLKNTRNVCQTAQCVEVAYKQRVLDLRAIPVTYPDLKTAIDATCREMAAFESSESPGTCHVSKSGSFGALGATGFHYALYCLGEPLPKQGSGHCTMSAMALFAQRKETGVVEMFHEHVADSGSYFDAPYINTNEYGNLLTLPVRVSGTGNFNDNDYFIRGQDRWVLMDTQSWLEDLNQRIPSGLAILKGVEPNIASLTASANLYRPEDPNCCPTGGSADISLGIAGNRLTIKSVKIIPPKAEPDE